MSDASELWNIGVRQVDGGNIGSSIEIASNSSVEALADAISSRCCPPLEKQRVRLIYRGRVIYDGSRSGTDPSTDANNADNPSNAMHSIQLKDVAGMCDGQTVHLVRRPVHSNNNNTINVSNNSNENRNNIEGNSQSSRENNNARLQMFLEDAIMATESLTNGNDNGNGNASFSSVSNSSVGGLLGMLISSAIVDGTIGDANTSNTGSGSRGIVSGVIRTEVRRSNAGDASNPNATTMNISVNSSQGRLRRALSRSTGTPSRDTENTSTNQGNDNDNDNDDDNDNNVNLNENDNDNDDDEFDENRANLVISAMRRASLVDVSGALGGQGKLNE